MALWTFTTTFALFKINDNTVGLRVSSEDETLGLDLKEHNTDSYADFEPKVVVDHVL